MKVHLSVVVPIHDEAPNLVALDAELREVLSARSRTAEILYVDDGSRDDSMSVLRGLAQEPATKGLRVRVLKLRRNYGQTAAIAAGFDRAEGEIVVPIDADLQNDPRDIPRLVEKLEKEGLDVVSGWRRHRQDDTVRVVPSRVASWLAGRLTGVRLHDLGCTLKAYRRSLLSEVRLYGDMHRFLPLHLARIGARVAELEVGHRPRRAGVSKYGMQRIFRVVADLILIVFMSRYYTRPMHFFGQAASLFSILMAVVGTLMLVFKFGWLRRIGIDYQASFIETPLPALGATFFIGAILSVFFGILAEVLVRVYYETQELRPYSIEEVVTTEPCAD